MKERRHPRLQGYDYSSPRAYFVTVCTANRQPLLAVCRAGCPHPAPGAPPLPAEAVFRYTDLGRRTDAAIRRTETAYPSVRVLAHVVMPDHWHLLLRILPPGEIDAPAGFGGMRASRPTLPFIVRAIKTDVSRRAGFPVWQASFYDHVVRTEQDLQDIADYIQQNPLRWYYKHHTEQ